jgi:hypothetical protein
MKDTDRIHNNDAALLRPEARLLDCWNRQYLSSREAMNMSGFLEARGRKSRGFA